MKYRSPSLTTLRPVVLAVLAHCSLAYAQSATPDSALPGVTVKASRGASYRIDPRFTLALSVNNLSDKTYWRSMSDTTYGNVYGDPRNATLVLRGQF